MPLDRIPRLPRRRNPARHRGLTQNEVAAVTDAMRRPDPRREEPVPTADFSPQLLPRDMRGLHSTLRGLGEGPGETPQRCSPARGDDGGRMSQPQARHSCTERVSGHSLGHMHTTVTSSRCVPKPPASPAEHGVAPPEGPQLLGAADPLTWRQVPTAPHSACFQCVISRN